MIALWFSQKVLISEQVKGIRETIEAYDCQEELYWVLRNGVE